MPSNDTQSQDMNETTTINLSYDPLFIVRHVMNRYAEEREGMDTKAVQFARYDYLHSMTDDELEGTLERYTEEELGGGPITLDDWRKDCEHWFRYIYASDRYKALLFKFNRLGYGHTGMGVADLSDSTFYDTEYGAHWSTMLDIMDEKYPELHNATLAFQNDPTLKTYGRYTAKQVDVIIRDQFEFVRGNRVE